MGRPRSNSWLEMAKSGFSSGRSRQVSISGLFIRYRVKTRQTRLTPWPIRVEQAEPAMPSFGNGPMPRISIGFRVMSRITASTRK